MLRMCLSPGASMSAWNTAAWGIETGDGATRGIRPRERGSNSHPTALRSSFALATTVRRLVLRCHPVVFWHERESRRPAPTGAA